MILQESRGGMVEVRNGLTHPIVNELLIENIEKIINPLNQSSYFFLTFDTSDTPQAESCPIKSVSAYFNLTEGSSYGYIRIEARDIQRGVNNCNQFTACFDFSGSKESRRALKQLSRRGSWHEFLAGSYLEMSVDSGIEPISLFYKFDLKNKTAWRFGWVETTTDDEGFRKARQAANEDRG